MSMNIDCERPWPPGDWLRFGADMALRQIPTGLFAKIKFCQGSLPYVYRITPDRAQTFNASLVAIPANSLP